MTGALAETSLITGSQFCFRGNLLFLEPSGILYWPAERLLVVSDLHLEKGSSFAARQNLFMPPYDTQATLETLTPKIEMLQPETVISLGDSFHDRDASARLPDEYRQQLSRLMQGREWVWINGNHDPEPPRELGGIFCQSLQVGNLNFIHEPHKQFTQGEIAGHLHPCAKIRRRGKAVRKRCFVSDGKRLIMPAFGAFTGGLNIRNEAYSELFEDEKLTVWMIGKDAVFEIDGKQCVR